MDQILQLTIQFLKGFVLANTIELIATGVVLVCLEVLLRLIPSKRSISILSLLSRLLVKIAHLIRKLALVLPENRKIR